MWKIHWQIAGKIMPGTFGRSVMSKIKSVCLITFFAAGILTVITLIIFEENDRDLMDELPTAAVIVIACLMLPWIFTFKPVFYILMRTFQFKVETKVKTVVHKAIYDEETEEDRLVQSTIISDQHETPDSETLDSETLDSTAWRRVAGV